MKTKTKNFIHMYAVGSVAGLVVGMLGGSNIDIAVMFLTGIIVVGFSKAGVI